MLGEVSFRGVANAKDIAVAPVEASLADRDLDGDPRATLGHTPRLMRGQIHVRIVDLGGATFEEIYEAPPCGRSGRAS